MSIEMKNAVKTAIENVYETPEKDKAINMYYCDARKNPIVKLKVLFTGSNIVEIYYPEYNGNYNYTNDDFRFYLRNLINAAIILHNANYAECYFNDYLFKECLQDTNFIKMDNSFVESDSSGNKFRGNYEFYYLDSGARSLLIGEEDKKEEEKQEEEKTEDITEEEIIAVPLARLPDNFDLYAVNPRKASDDGTKIFTIIGIDNTNHQEVCNVDMLYDDANFVHTMMGIQINPAYTDKYVKLLISYCLNAYGVSKIFYSGNDEEVIGLLKSTGFGCIDQKTRSFIKINQYSEEFEAIDDNVYALKRLIPGGPGTNLDTDKRHIRVFITVPNTSRITCEAIISSSVLNLDNTEKGIEIGDVTISHIKEYPDYEGKGYDVALVESLINKYSVKKILGKFFSKSLVLLCTDHGYIYETVTEDHSDYTAAFVKIKNKYTDSDNKKDPKSFQFLNKGNPVLVSEPYLYSNGNETHNARAISMWSGNMSTIANVFYDNDPEKPDTLDTLNTPHFSNKVYANMDIIIKECIKYFPSIINVVCHDSEYYRKLLRDLGFVYTGDDLYVRADTLMAGKAKDKEIVPSNEFVSSMIMKTLEEDIKEINGIISNESLWEKGYDGEEPNPHTQNIANWKAVLDAFENIKTNIGYMLEI